ncbi:MAG: restriction endonuclease subunit S [Candidatus Pacearchaeota archaeon]|jgi:type I restriction enzyme S subunit
MKQQTKFKETEIGEIPEDWEIITLKNACQKIGSGITPRGAEKVYKDKGVTLIRSQNVYNHFFSSSGLVFIDDTIAEEMKNVELKEKDLLLNITGDSVARCCLVPKEYLPARVNQHVSIIRTDHKILNPKFLQSYLTSHKMQDFMLSLAQSGGTRNALTKSMIESFIIPKPNIDEQQAIAKILSSLDAKIELNQKMNKTLEVIGQALFKHWFIDFEFPNEKGKPYKSSGGEKVDSELGEIPLGWKLGRLGDITSLIRDGTHNPPKRILGGVPLITGINVKDNFVRHDNITYITEENYMGIHKKYQPEENDLLITKIGTLGKVAIIRKNDLPIAIHCNVAIIRNNSNVSPQYLFWLFKSDIFQNQFHLKKKQTVQEFINLEQLSELDCIIPNKKMISSFDLLITPVFKKISLNNLEIHGLIQIRDSLLPKLISGKIRVKLK